MGSRNYLKFGTFFLVVGVLALAVTTSGCIFVSGKGLLSLEPRPLQETVLSGEGKGKILFLEITGVISEKEKGGLFSLRKEPGTVASVKEQLDLAAKDKQLSGLLLWINSPGGTVTASDIIYNELKTFKARKRVPVLALFSGTATSGAYYVAQAADRIVAGPTTVTGSIGVILMNLNLSGLMEKVGVSDGSIRSGIHKDLGSPFRKTEKAEMKILQGIVDDFHGRFCRIIDENRPALKLADNPELTDGRIFTAEQALDKGLVDEIGYFTSALDWLKKEAGAPDARLIRYKRTGEYLPNIYSLAAGAQGAQTDFNLIKLDVQSLLSGGGPAFMYLWFPSL